MKNAAVYAAAFRHLQLLAGALALLISDAAAGLASRLAGSLAFAAATVLCALAKVLCVDCLNMLHGETSNTHFYKFYHIFFLKSIF